MNGSVYGSGFFIENSRTFVTTFPLMYQLINLKDSSGLSSIFITKDNKKFQIKAVKGISALNGIVFLEVESYNGKFLKLPRHPVSYRNEAYTIGFSTDEIDVLKWTQLLGELETEVSFIGNHTRAKRSFAGGLVLNRQGEVLGMQLSFSRIPAQHIATVIQTKYLMHVLNESVAFRNNRLSVNEQLERALTDLESLAQKRDVKMQLGLADIFLEINNLRKAFFWYRKVAKQGLAQAQDKLAIMYYRGMGIPPNKTLALSWFRKAAKQGVVTAQYNLGIMLSNGDGVPQDKKQAALWFRKAADRGILSAQYHLASILYVGFEGVLQDKKQAAYWYRKVAEGSHADAQYNLAAMLFNGDGIPQDKKQAALWFRRSAEQGFAEAQYHLALIMRDNGNRAEALLWFRKAAKQEHVESQYELALLLLDKGTAQEKNRSTFFVKKGGRTRTCGCSKTS